LEKIKKNIFTEEHIFYEDLFTKCNYDLRKSLNILQGIAPFIEKVDSVDEFVGIIPKYFIDRFFNVDLQSIRKFVDDFVRSGYGFIQFLYQLNSIDNLNLDFRIVLSFFEEKAVVGCSSEIMMLDLCCKKIELIDKK